ncbi:pentatricopeptide repeat-containing protein At3g47530 [Cucurbita moschata]|uniref:Pentatricopeptide repeat-containing protein At3g47530 n=1 Tax=Cucurbita moschata TaxID=3662 RepID=A0A6J1E1Z3_CUCMO|nr:pentatricopeptide repeat-containing protein At3g47530 [Cucurbita moschata]
MTVIFRRCRCSADRHLHSLRLPHFASTASLLHSPISLLSSKFREQNSTLRFDREPLISLIKSCTHKSQLLQIHAHMIRTSFIQDPIVSLRFLTRIVSAPFRELGYSRRFFSQLTNPFVSHYNTLLRAYSLSRSPLEGLYMYRDMERRGVHADPLSSSFAVKSCIRMLSLFSGVQIHARIFRNGHQSDSLLLTSMMDLYSHCGKLEDACKLFDEIPQRDVVAWNVLISCLTRNKRTRDALGLFEIMQSPTYLCKPDKVTCLLLLQACADLNALEFGERIHSHIQQHGYNTESNLCNSLISMYSRCGRVDKAYEVFDKMPEKNVVSWSAMISGLSMNGHGREAIEAFWAMQKKGVEPDDHTFTAVLSACSHCGLVDEGMAFFDRMRQEFMIVPTVHHYGCMVDLLGRAGMLDQAYQLVMSMEVNPDATMWRTLLGACRIHGHANLGERIIEHLIELKSQEAGDYVLLLNIYSSAGNWVKVTELRKFMKERGIYTTPGCTTIELNGVVHEFAVDDISHPMKDKIYEQLDEINKQLKIAGYEAEISSELHNLKAEDKGYALSFHSEKLAIAFGVLATPPGRTIRVANNLRTCMDCHNFAKYVSSVYNRKVVVRDRSRFHHFREGRCSCNDYW